MIEQVVYEAMIQNAPPARQCFASNVRLQDSLASPHGTCIFAACKAHIFQNAAHNSELPQEFAAVICKPCPWLLGSANTSFRVCPHQVCGKEVETIRRGVPTTQRHDMHTCADSPGQLYCYGQRQLIHGIGSLACQAPGFFYLTLELGNQN